MKGWVGLVGWFVADGLAAHSGHPSAAGRAQDRDLIHLVYYNVIHGMNAMFWFVPVLTARAERAQSEKKSCVAPAGATVFGLMMICAV